MASRASKACRIIHESNVGPQMYHIMTSNKIRIPTLAPRLDDETQEEYTARVKQIHKIDIAIAELRKMHRVRTNATKAGKAMAERGNPATKTPADRRADLMADKIAKKKIVAVRKMQKYFMTINIIGQRVGKLREDHFRNGELVAEKGTSIWACAESYDGVKYRYEPSETMQRPLYASRSNMQTFYGHDSAKLEKTLAIRYSVATQLGLLLAAGDYRITGTDVLATRESSAALKEFFMFAHSKGCLQGVSAADMALCGWGPSNRDFSVKSSVPANKVVAQETKLFEYLEQYNAWMPSDCARVKPADISAFSAAAKLLACNADEFGASRAHVDDDFPVDLFLYAYSKHQMKQRHQQFLLGAPPMHIGTDAGASEFKTIWAFLTSTEVTNATTFRPFFSFRIFEAADLTALMLVGPAAAANNGNPPEKDTEPAQRDADYYAMQSARSANKLDAMRSPHSTMLPYTGADRHIWVEKLFGFEGFKLGLAPEPTNTIPPQRINITTPASPSVGSPRHKAYVALQGLSVQLCKSPCYDLVIRGWNTAIQWFSAARTRDDYVWIDLMVAALSALHNDEDVELDDVDEVFVVPREDQDEDEDTLDGDNESEDTDDDDTRHESEEEEYDTSTDKRAAAAEESAGY